MKRLFSSILKKIFSPDLNSLSRQISVEQRNRLYAKNDLLHNLFTILKQVGFNPGHIVDVGANHGTWTRVTLKYFPDAYYTLLEPQAHLQASVEDILKVNSRVKFYALGAGKETGSLLFTIVDRDDSCSFLHSEKEAAALGFSQVKIPVVSLNQFLASLNIPLPDIVKIDAEGLDIEVLSGAGDLFGFTEIFMVEAAVMNNIYTNSVLKVLAFMDENGYRLFDITDLNRTQKNNALWLVELVLIKKDGMVDKAINSYN